MPVEGMMMFAMRQLAPLLMILPASAFSASVELSTAVDTGAAAQTTPEQKSDLPDLGPNVVIKPRPNQPMVEEYRVNDRVFMIKVTPEKGFSYYLVDTDGDGRLDTRRNELEPHFLVPQWTLLRWK